MHSDIVYILLAFALGYLTGRADSLYRALRDKYGPVPKTGFFSESVPASRRQENCSPAVKISIDERKFVSEISTGSIQKSPEAAARAKWKWAQACGAPAVA